MRVLKDELRGLLEVVMESGRLGWKGRGERKRDVLMLLPVTGRSGGKRKRTVATMTYDMPITLVIQPRIPGSTNGRGGSIFRPRRQLMEGGMA